MIFLMFVIYLLRQKFDAVKSTNVFLDDTEPYGKIETSRAFIMTFFHLKTLNILELIMGEKTCQKILKICIAKLYKT